jgi:hypothetical protein
MAQKILKETSVTTIVGELNERIEFASLVIDLVRGELDARLQNAPVGVCEELGRIWDAKSDVPVGWLFRRPKFEEYEALHQAATQQTRLN